jgi:hypothetical protein
MRFFATVILLGLAMPSVASAWMINEDYQQRDNRPATDFEIFLAGDVRARITGGGNSSVTNPFPNPERATTLTEIGNTKIHFKGSGSIPKNLNKNHHFGIWGTGRKPKVRLKQWSYATSPYVVPVPKSNFDFAYNPKTRSLEIAIENLTEHHVRFSQVGIIITEEERPIEHLVRSVLPPEQFEPLPGLSADYAPEQRRSYTVENVDPSAYVITYATVQFTGLSTENAYNSEGIGTGGEWTQVAVRDEMVDSVTPVAPPVRSCGHCGTIPGNGGLISLLFILCLIAGMLLLRRRFGVDR